MFENNVVGGLIDGRYWPGLTDVDNSVPREFCFIWSTPYSETPNPALELTTAPGLQNSTTPMMWVMVCARRADADWVAGDQFLINANHVNSPSTVYTWSSPAPTVGNKTLAKADVDKLNVYPNPYIGYNTQELNRYARFVTFTHLPTTATIRIFNLAGILIRTLGKRRSKSIPAMGSGQ